MRNFSSALLGLSLLAAPAAAQGDPAAVVRALLAGAGLTLPPFAEVNLPPARVLQTAPTAPSLIPAGLWATLPVPDAGAIALLSGGVPGFNPAAARSLTPEAAENLFAAAVARGSSGLDLFTDPAFRGDEVYFLSQELIQKLFDRYEMRVLTPAYGSTTDGQAFHMIGLAIGRGRIDAFYDLDGFQFNNPFFPDGRYKLAGHVTEIIQGPGDLEMTGISIHVKIFQPTIKRIVKISPDSARVETSMGDRVKPLHAIRLR